jgi:hypothetical protein
MKSLRPALGAGLAITFSAASGKSLTVSGTHALTFRPGRRTR